MSPFHILLLLIVGGLVQYVLLIALFRAESHLMGCVSRWSTLRSAEERTGNATTASKQDYVVTEDGDLHPFDDVDARRKRGWNPS